MTLRSELILQQLIITSLFVLIRLFCSLTKAHKVFEVVPFIDTSFPGKLTSVCYEGEGGGV